ncbi:MAG: AAA family ATPase [Clostridia bacterium]|nr:AAA family ATPase [Clostridia bacterium]
MALCIPLLGESGSGKTTSMRNLPPEKTLYIDADGKGLQWRGWRQQFNRESGNYVSTSDKQTVLDLLDMVDRKQFIKRVKDSQGREVKDYEHAKPGFENVEFVVIDTLNGIMVDDEMQRMNEKGYDKWADLAQAVYGIIVYALRMRPELTVIFTAHTQTERDDVTGQTWTRLKTNGRKLDKIVLESKFSNVLHARCIDGQYVFETRANNSTAKTSMGAFDEATIPNDIMEVIRRLEEYR